MNTTKPNNLSISYYNNKPLLSIPVGATRDKKFGLMKANVLLEKIKEIAQFVKNGDRFKKLSLEEELFNKFNSPLILSWVEAWSIIRHREDIMFFIQNFGEKVEVDNNILNDVLEQ